MRPFIVRFTPFKNVDWGRLIEHLIAAFAVSIGTAGAAAQPIEQAVKVWFFGSLIYAGGFIQNAERVQEEGDSGEVGKVVK